MPKSLVGGLVFGGLTVVRWTEARRAWLCRCVCGGETYARAWALKNGRHRRCGCGRTAERLSTRLPNDLGPKRALYRLYRRAARNRNYAFCLSEARFVRLVDSSCHYCGASPRRVFNHNKRSRIRAVPTNGVDRVDNAKGYTTLNCVPCCAICNRAKGTLFVDEWTDWIRRVYRWQRGLLSR